jgi:hypothetical protein
MEGPAQAGGDLRKLGFWRTCADCRAVYYCSQICQTRHWAKHKVMCLQQQLQLSRLRLHAHEAKVAVLQAARPSTSANIYDTCNSRQLGEENN